MGKLKIIISLLFIGFALSWNYKTYIFDINYLQEFEVPNKGFPSDDHFNLYFRLPCPSVNSKLSLTTKYYDDYDDYYTEICSYTKKPTDEELTADTYSGDCERLHKDYKTKDKTYTKFIYEIDPFSSGVTYLVVKIEMRSKFKYFSVLVSPYKEIQRMIKRAIEYDEELIIDSETLSNTDKYFIFNTESKNGNQESITIKLLKDDINDFRIDLAGIKSLEDLTESPPI